MYMFHFRPHPRAFAAASIACALSAGSSTHARVPGGDVSAWGLNGGQLSMVPPGLTGVAELDFAYDCAVALKTDGGVIGWGSLWGYPVVIPSDLGPCIDISAGFQHIVAVKGGDRSSLGAIRVAAPPQSQPTSGLASEWTRMGTAAWPSEPMARLPAGEEASRSRSAQASDSVWMQMRGPATSSPCEPTAPWLRPTPMGARSTNHQRLLAFARRSRRATVSRLH